MMGKSPIPKEAVVKPYGGNMIEVYISTNDADELARNVLPKYGIYYPKEGRTRIADAHTVVVRISSL